MCSTDEAEARLSEFPIYQAVARYEFQSRMLQAQNQETFNSYDDSSRIQDLLTMNWNLTMVKLVYDR